MKKSMVRSTLRVIVFLLFAPYPMFAQSASRVPVTHSDSGQVLGDILKEIHLLRTELLRIAVNNNRSQLLIDRIRVQQEQIVRLDASIEDLQDKIDDLRTQQQRRQSVLAEVMKRQDTGVASDREVSDVKAEIEDFAAREQAMSVRQSAVASELDSARADLAELNKRLDEIDAEMVQARKDAAHKNDPAQKAKQP